ncbi:MAG: hypothetical protein R2705_16100 [Ilumatobacteraceae bacterium]
MGVSNAEQAREACRGFADDVVQGAFGDARRMRADGPDRGRGVRRRVGRDRRSG